jgi:hypothetical protein
MIANGRLSRDDSGVNVPVEYVFVIVITAMFFAMFLLLVNTTIRNTDESIVGQELGIIANDIANRITEFSGKIGANTFKSDNWTSNVSGYSEAIDLPDLAQGKQYTVVITFDNIAKTGKVKASYGSNVFINRTASFRSGTDVTDGMISSTDASPRISYDPDDHSILVVGS